MAPVNQLPLQRVPVTIVGGYLGAGKTTLINRLLEDDHSLRIAVLVNDFGEINVDADLIADHDGQTLALTNGCVCCSHILLVEVQMWCMIVTIRAQKLRTS